MDIGIGKLKYVGKNQIVRVSDNALVSPRGVVSAYNDLVELINDFMSDKDFTLAYEAHTKREAASQHVGQAAESCPGIGRMETWQTMQIRKGKLRRTRRNEALASSVTAFRNHADSFVDDAVK